MIHVERVRAADDERHPDERAERWCGAHRGGAGARKSPPAVVVRTMNVMRGFASARRSAATARTEAARMRFVPRAVGGGRQADGRSATFSTSPRPARRAYKEGAGARQGWTRNGLRQPCLLEGPSPSNRTLRPPEHRAIRLGAPAAFAHVGVAPSELAAWGATGDAARAAHRAFPASAPRRPRRRSSSRSSGACSCTRRSSAPRPGSSARSSSRASRWSSASCSSRLTGYVPLRAARRERSSASRATRTVSAVAAARLAGRRRARRRASSRWLAPETRGGGSDAIIDAFHQQARDRPRRVPLVKAVASILTLGTAAPAAARGRRCRWAARSARSSGRYLRVTDRERRILLVAGTAAGMAAVFRTPLGAALLAVEVLHRDDFESDALVPAVLASVVALLGLHLDLRRVDALRARRDVSVRPRAPAALRAAGRPRLGRRERASSATLRARPAADRAAARSRRGASRRSGGLALGVFATPDHHARRPAPRAARAGARDPRRRLRRGAGRDHRRAVVPARAGAASSCSLLLGVVKIVATSLTVGTRRQRGRLRPVARHRRALRRRVRARRAAPLPRSAHRSRARSRSSAWARSTAGSPTSRSRRSS